MNKTKDICMTLCFLFGISFVYILAREFEINEKRAVIQPLMLMVFICILIVFLFLAVRNKDKKEDYLIYMIMAAGIVLRVGYMLYTGCRLRGHDLGYMSMNGNGHATYILTLIHTGNLPLSNKGQMYQQPLYYYISAFFSKAVNGILSSTKDYYYVDGAKLVSCVSSCLNIYMVARFTDRFTGCVKNIVIMLVSFTPACIIAAGTVSTDALTMLFMTLCFFMTIKWYEDQNIKNTVILALCYGFGVMTKISVGVIAFFTTIYFIRALREIVNKKSVNKSKTSLKDFTISMFIFAVISLPLGLWYSYRNYSLFGQKFGYVLELSKSDYVYMGDKSYFARFLQIDIKSLFLNTFLNVRKDYNMPVYLLKSALFGEFSYNIIKLIPFLMTLCGVVFTVYLVTALIKCDDLRKDYGLIFITVLLFHIYFYIKYPFSCSMDFRYIIFICVPAGVLLGGCRSKKLKEKITCRIFDAVCILFCITSSIFFMII